MRPLLACAMALVLLAGGCGGSDSDSDATSTQSTTAPAQSAADAYRKVVEKVGSELRGGPILDQVRTEAEIRELGEYHVNSYRSSADRLTRAKPIERARDTQTELIEVLREDAREIEALLEEKASKGAIYEAVTASRRDTLRLSDDLISAAAIG